jgi:hypothetical protein
MIHSNVVRGFGDKVVKISEKYLVRPPQMGNIGEDMVSMIRSRIVEPRGCREIEEGVEWCEIFKGLDYGASNF